MDFVVPSMADWFTVAMGVGTVFVGLVCIVIICSIMSLFFRERKSKDEAVTPVAPVVSTPAVIENRQEIIAAVTAAAAEEMGTDVSALRVISFKKI